MSTPINLNTKLETAIELKLEYEWEEFLDSNLEFILRNQLDIGFDNCFATVHDWQIYMQTKRDLDAKN